MNMIVNIRVEMIEILKERKNQVVKKIKNIPRTDAHGE